MPGLVKVDPWISTDTDLPLVQTLATREERLATGVWIKNGMGKARGVQGPQHPAIAPGGMIRLSSDWIAGFTVGVSWSTGSPVPDQDQGSLPPQGQIVPGGGRRASTVWAAGWKIASIGCWTMGKIGASPGRRPMRLVGAASMPVGRLQRLPGVFRLKGRPGRIRRVMGTRPFPVAGLKPSPCGGAAPLRPTQWPGAGPAMGRPRTPLPRMSAIRPAGPPWPNRRAGRRMTCSSSNVGSVLPDKVQVPFGMPLHRTKIPFPVALYHAPPADAEVGRHQGHRNREPHLAWLGAGASRATPPPVGGTWKRDPLDRKAALTELTSSLGISKAISWADSAMAGSP